MIARWHITRYALNRPYRVHIGTEAEELRLIVGCVELCTMPKRYSQIEEYLGQETDCPSERIQALWLTLFARCYLWRDGRLIDSNYFGRARGESLAYTSQAAGLHLMRSFRERGL